MQFSVMHIGISLHLFQIVTVHISDRIVKMNANVRMKQSVIPSMVAARAQMDIVENFASLVSYGLLNSRI